MRRQEAEARRLKGLPAAADEPTEGAAPATEDEAPPSRESMVAFLMQTLGCTEEAANKEYDWMLANHNAGTNNGE